MDKDEDYNVNDDDDDINDDDEDDLIQPPPNPYRRKKLLGHLFSQFLPKISEKSSNVIWSISGKSFDRGLLHQRDFVISI